MNYIIMLIHDSWDILTGLGTWQMILTSRYQDAIYTVLQLGGSFFQLCTCIYIFLLCQTEKPSSCAVDVLQLKFIISCSCSQTYLFDCFEDIGTYTDFGNGWASCQAFTCQTPGGNACMYLTHWTQPGLSNSTPYASEVESSLQSAASSLPMCACVRLRPCVRLRACVRVHVWV